MWVFFVKICFIMKSFIIKSWHTLIHMKVILNQARCDNICKSRILKSKVIHSKFEGIKQKVMINPLYSNIIGMLYFQSNKAKVV